MGIRSLTSSSLGLNYHDNVFFSLSFLILAFIRVNVLTESKHSYLNE